MYSKYTILSCLSGFLFFVGGVQATERSPWFGNDNEFEWRSHLEHTYYDDVDTEQGSEQRKGKDSQLKLSLGLATMGAFYAEAELTAYHLKADSMQSMTRFDALSLQGSYLLMNDIVGEPFSVVAGTELALSPSSAQRELGIIRHGNIELETYVSIGREKSLGRTWDYRYWSSFALGVANRGSFWAKAYLSWEKNIQDQQKFQVFSHYRQGFGSKKLNQISEFSSYRALDYASADLGMKYSHQIGVMGELSLSYARRIYAQYTGKSSDTISIAYFLPFGL